MGGLGSGVVVGSKGARHLRLQSWLPCRGNASCAVPATVSLGQSRRFRSLTSPKSFADATGAWRLLSLAGVIVAVVQNIATDVLLTSGFVDIVTDPGAREGPWTLAVHPLVARYSRTGSTYMDCSLLPISCGFWERLAAGALLCPWLVVPSIAHVSGEPFSAAAPGSAWVVGMRCLSARPPAPLPAAVTLFCQAKTHRELVMNSYFGPSERRQLGTTSDSVDSRLHENGVTLGASRLQRGVRSARGRPTAREFSSAVAVFLFDVCAGGGQPHGGCQSNTTNVSAPRIGKRNDACLRDCAWLRFSGPPRALFCSGDVCGCPHVL